ncbi:MAG: hypothetical protein K2H64_12445, partial [Desulfovibrio sp.]|nr:hypothetical protein [Desulfovibrio sp.]
AENVYSGLDGEIGDVIEEGVGGEIIGSEKDHFNSSYAGVRFLSRVGSVKYMVHDYNLAIRTLESAVRMAILGAIPQMTYAANAAARASERRSSLSASPEIMSVTRGEDAGALTYSLWLTPLYASTAGFDPHANNYGYDFAGRIGGLVIGADISRPGVYRAGVDLSVGGGYSQSGGDQAKTVNNMSFWGAGLNGALYFGNFALSGDARYTASSNYLRQ